MSENSHVASRGHKIRPQESKKMWPAMSYVAYYAVMIFEPYELQE